MLDVIHHKQSSNDAKPDEVFLEIIMKPSSIVEPSSVRWVYISIAVACLSLGLIFWAIGAGPVLPFMGIEVVLLYFAYQFGFRHGQKVETVSISQNDLVIRKKFGGKNNEAIRFQPYWINLDEENEHGQHMKLKLRSKGYYVEVGSLLPPAEKVELADTLRSALQTLKGAS